MRALSTRAGKSGAALRGAALRGARMPVATAAPTHPPYLLLGVMSDPRLTKWRAEYRHALAKQQQGLVTLRVSTRFVLGNVRTCAPIERDPDADLGPRRCSTSNPLSCPQPAREQSDHGDLLVLMSAGECGSRSGVAVAQKAFEWYAYASSQAEPAPDWSAPLSARTASGLLQAHAALRCAGSREDGRRRAAQPAAPQP